MKALKISISIFIAGLIILSKASAVFAIDKTGNTLSAKAMQYDNDYIEDTIDKRVLKKYKAIEIKLNNISSQDINLSLPIYYQTGNDTSRLIPTSKMVYKKSRRSLVLRATLWGIIGGGFLSLYTIPASIAHTKYNNPLLKDNIEKNIFRKNVIFKDEKYSAFVFIPRNHYARYIILKDLHFKDQKPFDIKIPIKKL